MVYAVTAVKDVHESNGVEVAGVFNVKEKAYEARVKVIEWMKNSGYKDYAVFVYPMNINRITWYEVEEDI